MESQKKIHVLIVESNENAAKLVGDTLNQAGVAKKDITFATRYDEAYLHLHHLNQDQKKAVVISDYRVWRDSYHKKYFSTQPILESALHQGHCVALLSPSPQEEAKRLAESKNVRYIDKSVVENLPLLEEMIRDGKIHHIKESADNFQCPYSFYREAIIVPLAKKYNQGNGMSLTDLLKFIN